MRIFVGISMVVALAMISVGLASSGNSGAGVVVTEPTVTPVGDVAIDEVTPVPTSAASANTESERDQERARRDLDEDRCYYGDVSAESPVAGHLIIVDPGHGDNDLGTINSSFELHESDLVLNISRLLRNRLMRNGADVCMTRTQDVYLDLAERAAFANEQRGDAFVSVHLNSLPDSSNSYAMTMWGDEAKDLELAEVMLESLRYEMALPEWSYGEPNPMDPEEYRLDFLDSAMLRSAEMPAVLAEATFLSATWEAEAFRDGINDGTRWREHQAADALYAGLEEYFSLID